MKYYMIETDPAKDTATSQQKTQERKEKKPTQVKHRAILRFRRNISFQEPPPAHLKLKINISIIESWELENPTKNRDLRGKLLHAGDAGKKDMQTIQTTPHRMGGGIEKSPRKRQGKRRRKKQPSGKNNWKHHKKEKREQMNTCRRRQMIRKMSYRHKTTKVHPDALKTANWEIISEIESGKETRNDHTEQDQSTGGIPSESDEDETKQKQKSRS